MHRNPRHADVERLLGALTLAQGIGMALPFPSLLLGQLRPFGGGWLWVALHVMVGAGAIAASYLTDLRARVGMMALLGILWGILLAACVTARLPVASLFALVIVWTALTVIRRLRAT